MSPLGVAGGRQGRPASAADRDHRPLYDLAVFGVLGAEGYREVLRYRATAPWVADGVGHRFGAPGVDGDRVWLCTERDVVCWPGGDRFDQPAFADLHHVAATPEGLLAVATGAGGVVRATDGRFWPVHPGATAPTTDVRCLPFDDVFHPNHLVVWRGRTWVTRGGRGDVVPLEGGPPVQVADVVIHDGFACDEGVWFTAVDGRLVLVDLDQRRVLRSVVIAGDGALGWCRGLVLDGDTAWVGFTRLRATRLRRNLAWLAGRLRGHTTVGTRPTRVVRVELGTGRVLEECPLEAHGVDAVFGLCGLPGALVDRYGAP